MFYAGDLSVPFGQWSFFLVQGFVGPIGFVVEDAIGVPKVHGLLSQSKHLFPLLSLIYFVKQRVGLVVVLEDWLRQAIHGGCWFERFVDVEDLD